MHTCARTHTYTQHTQMLAHVRHSSMCVCVWVGGGGCIYAIRTHTGIGQSDWEQRTGFFFFFRGGYHFNDTHCPKPQNP